MTDPQPRQPTDAPPVRAPETQAVPAKCVACEREISAAVVCDYCHSLNPISAPTDYFTLLGAPRKFDLDADELRRKYLELNRYAHPDFHTNDSPEVKDLSLTVASALNDAYRILSDPISRAAYLLELLGGKSSADDKSTPDGFLAEVATVQEELYEARAAGDDAKVNEMAATLAERLDAMVAELAEVFGGFGAQVGCEAIRQSEMVKIRRQLNAISYIRRLLTVARGG